MAAAQHLFNRDGYFATNSNEIAKAAGYSPGTFYTYFHDKREIFLEIYIMWVAAEWAGVDRALSSPAPIRSRIDATIAALASHHKSSAVFRKSLRALAATDAIVRDAQNAQRRRQMLWLKDLCTSEGWPAPTNDVCLIVLLLLERTLDAIAEGDARSLQADERATIARIAETVTGLLEPRP